jgi:hypothetical protein
MLRPISGEYQMQEEGDGLNIVLRGTTQLDNFPQARDGFLHAAETWKTKIKASITIIIDVDFGPTRFGQSYPQGVLGSTGAQNLFDSSGYADVRAGLVARASSAETELVNALPVSQVPTDLGATGGFSSPSAVLRALGLIDAVANPSAEPQFGNPPSIGFNSAFTFDFDASNGIDSDKIDFDAVAVHEIGHALGFSSRVGALELNPQLSMAVTVLDLFRFRPGTTMANFASAQRILSSGGEQVFFTGLPELAMSTGRPDGSGGDSNQASHWKSDQIVQPTIGIMAPTLARGQRSTISDNDLRAFDVLGYNLEGADEGDPDAGDPGGPELTKVSYNGSAMTIKGGPFSGTLQLEVNGAIVAPPRKIKNKGGGTKLKISGSRSQLNLNSGQNRVRVIAGGLRSAVTILDL